MKSIFCGIILALKKATMSTIPIMKKVRNFAVKEENLYFTNVYSSLLMSAAGDIVIQIGLHKPFRAESLDLLRTYRMALSDGYTSGTINHFAYRKMDQIWPQPSLQNACRKLIVDQTVLMLLSLSVFYLSFGYMSDYSAKEIYIEMQANLMRLYKANVYICGVTQLINFLYVPSQYRVIFQGIISLSSAMYGSYFAHIHSFK